MKEKIKFFFLDGSINYDELNKIDKIRLKKSMNNKQKKRRTRFCVKNAIDIVSD